MAARSLPQKFLLVLVLLCLPSAALAVESITFQAFASYGGGGPIYGLVDGSQMHTDRSWIDTVLTTLTFETGGRFEIRNNRAGDPEETLLIGGTVLDSHLMLAPFDPMLTSWDGSVITLDLALDYFALAPDDLEDWRRATFTITINWPAYLITSGGGFIATPNVSVLTPTPVPEPATLLLLGTGLVGLAWMGTRRQRA